MPAKASQTSPTAIATRIARPVTGLFMKQTWPTPRRQESTKASPGSVGALRPLGHRPVELAEAARRRPHRGAHLATTSCPAPCEVRPRPCRRGTRPAIAGLSSPDPHHPAATSIGGSVTRPPIRPVLSAGDPKRLRRRQSSASVHIGDPGRGRSGTPGPAPMCEREGGDRALHPPRARRRLDRRGAHDRLARRRGRGRRGARRPDGGRARGDPRRRPSRSRPSRSASGSPTTTSPPSSTCSPPPPGPRGAGSTSGSPPPTCSTPRWRCSCARAGRGRRAGRAGAGRRAGRARARARRHAVRGPHPRRPRRADLVRPQAGRLRLRGAPQRRAAGARLRAGGHGRDLRRGRDLRVARPGLRGARARRASACAAEPVSTQVVPRDRHAELVQAIALAGAGLERLATEIRHLQRTEVREVEEPFRAGQKGSSAMPHKRNPIVTERITGLARVLRGYAQAAVEDVALWHERDISHSGAERVILPDATIVLDYMQHLALRVVRGHGRPRRPHAGEPRADLRRAVLPARAARAGGRRHAARRRLPDRPAPGPAGVGHPDAAARRCSSASRASSLDLDAIFDYGHYMRHVPEVLARLEEIPTA